jgi:1-acyl-sn-glycerol-3-phosphate acyltransferase
VARAQAHKNAPLLLMNHTSFFDFFVFTSRIPMRLMMKGHVRTMINAKLMKWPIYGSTVGLRCGSFPVHFAKQVDGKCRRLK